MLEAERIDLDVACKIYDLRTKADFSQRGFAKRIGTSAANVCRLENADYQGHSLSMLPRIAAALEMRMRCAIPTDYAKVKAKDRVRLSESTVLSEKEGALSMTCRMQATSGLDVLPWAFRPSRSQPVRAMPVCTIAAAPSSR